jgi:hypothetical protein
MASSIGPLPRAHHFTPQCWLAGFTEGGDKDGRLWVTDLKRRKQWVSNPRNAGHRRDFYRVSDPLCDPVAFEKAFGKIETAIAPLLKTLDQEQRAPRRHELESLLTFMAIQWMRVPAFRPTILRIADSIYRSWFSQALSSPDSWAAALEEVGVSAEAPGADYDGMLAFERSGQYSLSAEPEWYLERGFKAADHIVPLLEARHWTASISASGSFIGSDNPVAMDGTKGQDIGFKSAEVVLFPVSRHVLLYGTNAPVVPMTVSLKRIAEHNTLIMLNADEQVYSHVPDFCWLDERRTYQTDWRLFSKEKFQ